MKSIEILILEHDPIDVGLLQYELKKSKLDYNFKIVENEADYKNSLQHFIPDIILSDYSLPNFDGLKAFHIAKKMAPDVPFIIVSGVIGEENAVELIKIGVTDYVLKDKMYQVTPKILRAMREANESKGKKQSDSLLSASEKKYRELFHLSPIPMWLYDPETYRFLNVNDAAIRHYGYSLSEFLNLTVEDLRPEEEVTKQKNELNATSPDPYSNIIRHKKKNGTLIHVSIQSNTIDFQGKEAILVLATDTTDRINYTKAIEEQNTKLKEIAWLQSHIVRAPLARIMGLVNCLNDPVDSISNTSEMLNYIYTSALELDDVIREIVNKTEEVTVHHSNGF